MKHFFLVMAWVASGLFGLMGSLHARDYEPRWRPHDREMMWEVSRHDAGRDNVPDNREDRFAERRERMRALREEMLRSQPQHYRDDDARRLPLDRREFVRPPMPLPPAREADGLRRLSPEERRQFRRQIHDAGRDVYRGQ